MYSASWGALPSRVVKAITFPDGSVDRLLFEPPGTDIDSRDFHPAVELIFDDEDFSRLPGNSRLAESPVTFPMNAERIG